MTRTMKVLIALFALVGVGSACFWAGTVLTANPIAANSSVEDNPSIEVSVQTVGRSITVNASVIQDKIPLGASLRSGVITAVSDATSFSQGDTAYAVDGLPVRVVRGTTPFYRDLAETDTGDDVRQLNQLLVDLGYLRTAGNSFTEATTRAIKAWQKHLGIEQTGTVERGELVAVAQLPATITIDAEHVYPGAVIDQGAEVMSTLAAERRFELVVDSVQARAITAGAALMLTYGDNQWPAVVADTQERKDDTGQTFTALILSSPDGGAVCVQSCDALPAAPLTYVPARIDLVPEVTGPAVPVTAIVTTASGTTVVDVVTDAADSSTEQTPGPTPTQQAGVETREVTVLGSGDGIAVVEGLNEGERVLVYGGRQSQDSAPATAANSTEE